MPAKPSILYEPPYENLWTDAKGSRGAGYKAFQNGMYGYGYGANGVWNDLYTATDNGTAYLQPQNYTNWYDGANLPAAAQLTFLKNFYTSLEWWKLIPKFDDASWASFPDASKSLLSTDGQKTFVVYFFGDGMGTGTLNNLLNNAVYTSQWFNPVTGSYTDIGGFTTTTGQWVIPARPTANDWVLLLKTNAEPPVLGNNLALNKTYSSSSNYNTSQTAEKAFDGNLTTNWQSQDGTFINQWLSVNFGTATTFNTIRASEYGGRTTGYRVEYSNDGTNWQTAHTGTLIGGSSLVSFPAVTGNYARLYLTGGSQQPIIYELEVYNTSTFPPSSINLALNKTYSSSSNWDGTQTADKACDGNAGTNWQAQNGTFANQWLTVNFGTATSFDSVRLSEYGDRTTGYRIEYSTNGTTWQTAYTGTSIGTSKAISFTSVTGNYARIYFTSGNSFAPIIYEFEIYKKPPPTSSPNLALNKTYSSSSNWDASQTADKACDGTPSTNWQAQNGTFPNQWLQVNFGTATTFNKVVLSEYGDRTQGFRIEYSSNGSTWQTAYTGTTIGNSNTINFTAVTANYARLYFTLGTSFAPIIYEFEVYNASANRMAQINQPVLNIDEKSLAVIYPNPSRGLVRVTYKLPTKTKASVQIYSLEGKVVKQLDFISTDSGSGKIDLDINNLANGIYIVKIGSKNNIKTYKLTIAK